jgi:hypothetical protein
MSHRPPGRTTRRSAFTLSLALVLATLAVPALAQTTAGTYTAAATAAQAPGGTADFSVTLTNTTSETVLPGVDYADVILPSGLRVTGTPTIVTTPTCLASAGSPCPPVGASVFATTTSTSDGRDVLQITGNATTFLSSGESLRIAFSANADCTSSYTFETRAWKFANLSDPVRRASDPTFTLVGGNPTVDCLLLAPPLVDSRVTDERDGSVITAYGPDVAGASIALAFRDVDGAGGDTATADTFSAACDTLLDTDAQQPQRLARHVAELVPDGYRAGDLLIATSSTPRSVVVVDPASYANIGTGGFIIGDVTGDSAFTTDAQILERLLAIRTNRALPSDTDSDAIWLARITAGTRTLGDARTAISAKGAYQSAEAFQLCFAPEKASMGSLSGLAPLGTTELFGPVLLDDCGPSTAPCVLSRTKVDGAVQVEISLPAEDPYFR